MEVSVLGEAVIRTHKLTKWYGKHRGVIELDLEVRQGEVLGYLGPNGAGKTTTIRLLLDFLRPTAGRAEVFGLDPRRDSIEIRRRTGYLPGELALYGNLTGQEFLRYAARLRGGVDWDFTHGWAERLKADLSRPIRTLSHGNKQKIGLIQAFMHRPSLLILDEPSSGLDPLIQHEFYRMVAEAKAEGRTVLLSSHNLPEVERVCDRVGIIRDGRLLTVEGVASLKERSLRRLEIHFASAPNSGVLAGVSGVQDVEVADGGILRCTVRGSLDPLVKALARFEVINLVSHEPTLEEVFMAYYGGDLKHAG
ncbi:MAG: ABC transporter ATP-binding protein [Firmicutes bacterium]|nr:ABC transporter ATP-binding protein [Bacillota bacterium]